MIGLRITVDKRIARIIERAAKKGAIHGVTHGAGAVRKTAKELIRVTRKWSRPGEPVHSREGQAKKAIFYAIDKNKSEALIGFSQKRMGGVMEVHEKGGTRRDVKMAVSEGTYPARPVMGPALQINLPRFAEGFRGSIGP